MGHCSVDTVDSGQWWQVVPYPGPDHSKTRAGPQGELSVLVVVTLETSTLYYNLGLTQSVLPSTYALKQPDCVKFYHVKCRIVDYNYL